MPLNPSRQSCRFNRAFLWLMGLLLFAAPLYYQINPGGEGLLIPFNNIVWLLVSFIIGLAIFRMLQLSELRIPSITMAMLFFLATTTLLGLFKSVTMPEAWLFRSLALWAGILFYLSLAQFKLNARWRDNLLFWLLICSMIQALISLAQILIVDPPLQWLPVSIGIPRGIFQQQNINASLAATGMIVGIFLVTRPSYQARKPVFQGLIWIAIGLNTVTIVSSGSRIGLLAAVLGGVLMLTARYAYLRQHKSRVALLLFTVAAFGFAGNMLPSKAGLDRGMSKLAGATDSSQDVRLMIYGSTFELVKENPILGYGIGQFQSVWHEKKADYLQQHPDSAVLSSRLSHPHNELLYWAIEGGLAAVIGILVMAGALLFRCWQLGWQRGGAYLAMLLPITAHTQVELPFYISQLHWIIFVFLIYQVGSHRTKIKTVNISQFARTMMLALALIIPVATTVFAAKNLTSLTLTMDFITGKNPSLDRLQQAGRNLYFSRWITAIRMQIIFQSGYENDDQELLAKYIPMAQEYLQTVPDANTMKNLSLAFHKLGKYDASHRVLYKAFTIYPDTLQMQDARRLIIELDKDAGIFERYWRQQPAD